MKATLEFTLPEEEPEHSYALAGTNALLVIEDILSEIRSYLKHGDGEFREFYAEVWNDETSEYCKTRVQACEHTLEKVRDLIIEYKRNRNLPELI